jgi:two-component system sensor histidine kinase RegB
MVWDIIHLTLLIYITGGPMNPFTFLYLLHVTLAAILMQQKWAWSLASMTVFCYALLFFLPPAESIGSGIGPDMPICLTRSDMGLHLQGMWIAYTITALFIVYFLNRIRDALDVHQQTLVSLEDEKMKSDKLAALATMAAGAAHEFSSPLSTITIAAGEMINSLESEQIDEDLLKDARLIKSEVQRCRMILRQLSADAGEHASESFRIISVGMLMDMIGKEFTVETGKEVKFKIENAQQSMMVPVHTWVRSIKGLLKNSYDADNEAEITCRCHQDTDNLYIVVSDNGPGMDDDTFSKATDPFFTTKETGKGMGLGLFLARTMTECFDGDLQLESVKGKGTTITIKVALEKITDVQNLR